MNNNTCDGVDDDDADYGDDDDDGDDDGVDDDDDVHPPLTNHVVCRHIRSPRPNAGHDNNERNRF